MYPAPFNYHRPQSLEAAIGLLSRYGDDASIMAGGQSLIPMLKMRVGEMTELIDIRKLSDLDHIEQRGQTLHIGALATHARIASAEVANQIPLLRECGGGIADRQVRNMGTIGGGVSVADPSGDWPTGLAVLDAQLLLTGLSGTRLVSISDFIVDAYTTCLESCELVTEIQIPVPPAGSGSAYVAFKRAAPAYPTASAGIQLTVKDNICTAARLALGAAAPVAVVCRDAEALLLGKEITTELLESAAEAIVAVAEPPPDARGSEAFKRAMLRKLVVEAGQRALGRCRGEDVSGAHHYA
ncbi:MAG: xanthine dehydrogenase family protein subunit M [Halieaceae bacterium]|jgi:aerobic carbon-monoxide dehydrogenase medium subunit|nr:xanthine dehydrogenase family protein subunit M [Halieaceae bacterium]